MKIKLLFATLLLAAFIPAACVSCQPNNGEPTDEPDDPENVDPQDPKNPDDEGKLVPGTFKFVASPLQGTWKEGDQIYVHGSLGSWGEVVTLKASDISADGKTATGELGDVTTVPADPDGLYAGWPDEAVRHNKTKIGAKTAFEHCDRMLTAAYLNGDTFTFIDVSSSLTFSVSGDYDKYALCCNVRDGIEVNNFEVDYTSKGLTMTQKANTGYPFQYGSIENGKVTMYMPGNMTFKGGITVYLGKGEAWTGIYTSNGDLTLEPGKTKDLGALAPVEAYNGPAPRMPKMNGNSQKFTVKFQELSGLCLSEDGSFIWGVGDEGDLAKLDFEGKLIGDAVHIGGDSEDVSWNRDTKDLLIGLEPDGAGVVTAPYTGRVSTLFNIAACKNYGNSGIEGLTYYKDGLIFCGAQANSHFFLCDLNTKTVLKSQQMWNKNLLSEIAGMCYDPLTDWLWVIDSEAKKVFVFSAQRAYDELNKDGGDVYYALLGAYPVKGDNPESVCVDHGHGCIWVGDDYGSTSYLYRLDFDDFNDFNLE